jgi:hypothetical protein
MKLMKKANEILLEIRVLPMSLLQVRTSTMFFGLVVVQHVTSTATYVTGTSTLAYSSYV